MLSITVASAAFAAGAPGLPRAGLVMHLDSALGVQNNDGRVEYWWDQSGHGQDLRSTGDVRLIPNALYGKPVIELNASSDQLEQVRPSSLPAYNNDRTVIILSAPSNAAAEFGWGQSACGSRFVVQHTPAGYSGLSTGCASSAMHAQQQYTAGRWRLNTAIVHAGTARHLLDGKLVDGRTRPFNTQTGPFRVGITSSGEQNLRVAAVLVYNWALGRSELERVYRYLGHHYFQNADRWQAAPTTPPEDFPAPILALSKQTTADGNLRLGWRVSFADECGASNGWSSSRATTGTAVISNPQHGSQYGLNCWHRGASTTRNFAVDLRPINISWQASTVDNVSAYQLLVGNQPNNYTSEVRVPAVAGNSHDLMLSPGTYYLAMRSIGKDGLKSRLSLELSFTVD